MANLTKAPDSKLWGLLAGLIVTALIAVPLAAAIGFATHPASRFLFTGALSDATPVGYVLFWIVAAVLLAALPVLVGVGITRLDRRTLSVIGVIVVLFLIALIVLAQLSF